MKIEVGHVFESRLSWMFKAAKVYRLALAASHLCGGPSPRETETAVTTLLNSPTGLYRNVQKLGLTLGIQSGYKKSRNLTSKAPGIVVKFLPIPFAVILATIILRVKPIEAEFSKLETQVSTLETLSYLYTEYGDPVNPVKMAETLRTSGWDSSIIVMPTGSSKSRLIWSFGCLTECAIIFAPYRLLVDKLVIVMTEHGQTFRWPLTQHQGSVELLLPG